MAMRLILVPLTLTKIDDLDFGTVVPSPARSGFVSINATTGARTVGGGVTGVPSVAGNRAYFGGAGRRASRSSCRSITPAELTSTTNPADKIQVLGHAARGIAALKTIDPVTRAFFFGVGGIIIARRQPARRRLRGKPSTVTANYL